MVTWLWKTFFMVSSVLLIILPVCSPPARALNSEHQEIKLLLLVVQIDTLEDGTYQRMFPAICRR